MVEKALCQVEPAPELHDVLLSDGMSVPLDRQQGMLTGQHEHKNAYHDETGMSARNVQSQKFPTKKYKDDKAQATDILDVGHRRNLQGEQMPMGGMTHATSPVAGTQKIATQMVSTTTGRLLGHNMLTEVAPNRRSGPMTVGDVDARIHAGMDEITRYCRMLESQYQGPLYEDDASSDDTLDRVTRVTVVTTGGQTTPPHPTVRPGWGSKTPPRTTPLSTTPPPVVDGRSEPPPTSESAGEEEQLWVITTLFLKCQVLAFFVTIWAFSLYILYCEMLEDKRGVGHDVHYGPWKQP